MDPLADIDLNLILALHHLLESGSVGAAATELGVGQPAMSASLSRLRGILGDPLLVRAGRGMRRTDRAEELRRPVSELVDQARGVLAAMAPFDPARDAWTARLAVGDETRAWLGPALLARVRAEAPAVDLRLRRLTMDSPSAGRSGAIDLAIFPDPAGIPSGRVPDLDVFVVRRLYTVRFVVAASPRHPAPDEWSVERYAAAQHVLVNAWADTDRGGSDDELAVYGLSRRIAVTVPTFSEAITLLIADPSLVAALPERVTRGTGLRTWPPPWGEREMHVCYAYHPRATRDPRSRWLRALVESVVAEDAAPVAGGAR